MKRRRRGESGVRFVEEEKKKEDRASRAGEGESPWTRMRRTILHGGQRYRHLLQNMPPAPPLWERGEGSMRPMAIFIGASSFKVYKEPPRPFFHIPPQYSIVRWSPSALSSPPLSSPSLSSSHGR